MELDKLFWGRRHIRFANLALPTGARLSAYIDIDGCYSFYVWEGFLRTGVWEALDPITAQAVLYHLLSDSPESAIKNT